MWYSVLSIEKAFSTRVIFQYFFRNLKIDIWGKSFTQQNKHVTLYPIGSIKSVSSNFMHLQYENEWEKEKIKMERQMFIIMKQTAWDFFPTKWLSVSNYYPLAVFLLKCTYLFCFIYYSTAFMMVDRLQND